MKGIKNEKYNRTNKFNCILFPWMTQIEYEYRFTIQCAWLKQILENVSRILCER